MARKKTQFDESAYLNDVNYIRYFNTLKMIATSSFKYTNMPNSVDVRFLELGLFNRGYMVFFYDEDLQKYLALNTTLGCELDVYNNPLSYVAYANNGYQAQLTNKDSVIIYNNYLKQPTLMLCEYFAKRLYDFDSVIDVNVRSQKTPILIACNESEKLAMKNVYMQYDGNQPVIFTYKDFITADNFKVVNTQSPYVADKIYQLKSNIWNEALTQLGITNTTVNKKERLITDEVQRSQGGVFACRNSRLKMREQCINDINKMFNLNIQVEFNDDVLKDIGISEEVTEDE